MVGRLWVLLPLLCRLLRIAGGAPVLPDSLVGVSAASGVVLGSLRFEVGARAVDSRVGRFTAPDPLAAPVGAGWGADRFCGGGNPVSLVNPWGLSPVSVEDFEKQSRPLVSPAGCEITGSTLVVRWLLLVP